MPETSLADMRLDYGDRFLDVPDLAPMWHQQFERWIDDAARAGVVEPNAMVVATADAAGEPTSRSVLCKGFDERGVVFYTNHDSAKGAALRANPRASATFPWYAQSRQVHVRGRAELVARTEVETYWRGRPRGSQIGAWASAQSSPVSSRADLDDAERAAEERFAGCAAIPPPPHWGGWRIVPDAVEFWQGRTSRLHDRLCYHREADGWTIRRLAP